MVVALVAEVVVVVVVVEEAEVLVSLYPRFLLFRGSGLPVITSAPEVACSAGA